MAKIFSIKKAVKFGWDSVKQNIGFFVILLFMVWILNLFIIYFFDNKFVDFVVDSAIILGLIGVSLRFADRGQAEFGHFFRTQKVFPQFFVAALLYHLLVTVGLLLLIVPGIIWALQYKFYGYFIAEGAGPIEALKKSYKITKGHLWELFWFNVILIGILILGIMAFLVGLFVAIPLIMNATAHAYRQLSGNKKI